MSIEKLTPQTFAANPAWVTLAEELIKGPGGLTQDALKQEVVRAKSDPDRKATLIAMLKSLQQAQPPAGSFASEVNLRNAPVDAVPTAKKIDEETARFRAFLDTRIIEQDAAKEAGARYYKTVKSKLGLQKKPLVKLFVGPPGVGKTLMSKAEAEAIHGNEDSMIFIDCTRINSIMDLGRIIGVGRGFQGSNEDCLFTQEAINRKFGEKRPIIIHIDEPDKMPPEVAKMFWNTFNNFFQTGKMELDSGTIDLGGKVIVNIATNSGHDKAKHLQGQERRDTYAKEAGAALAAHTNSRIDNVVAFDPLSQEARKKIAKLEIEKLFKGAIESTAKLGKVVRIEPPPQDLCDLVARLAANDDFGARPVASFTSQVLIPLLDDVIGDANDEETFQLRMSGPIDPETLAKIEGEFSRNEGRLPNGFDAPDFNIQMVLKNPPPQLSDYRGEIPGNLWGGEMRMFGSGVVAGQSFFMYNRDDGEAGNELKLIKAGRTFEEDEIADVPLPPELANAHFVYCTPIHEGKDEHGVDIPNKRVMIVGISTPSDEGVTKPQIVARIWEPDKVDDHGEPADPWSSTKAPPIALGDASFGSVGGQVLMWGGRRLVRDKSDGSWTTPAGTTKSVGKRIENQGYYWDTKTGEWDVTANAPKTARARAAAVRYESSLQLVGGEMIATNAQQVTTSKSAQDVTGYDPVTHAFKEGPELKNGIAFAGAYLDDFKRIRVVGGAELVDSGYVAAQKMGIASLDPRLESPMWKDRGNLGLLGMNLIAIPHPKGGVLIGPFYDGGEIRWKLEKAPEMEVKG